jgi:hypothetical protein
MNVRIYVHKVPHVIKFKLVLIKELSVAHFLYDHFSTQSTKHVNAFAPDLARVSNIVHVRHWALPFATIHEKPFPLPHFVVPATIKALLQRLTE